MHFCFYPKHEHGCPNVSHCPHLGGAALGTLVEIANTSGDTIDGLHQAVDLERKRNTELVEENPRLEKALEQAKLELKLERQNKIENVYRVVCYRHEAACCDDCGKWVEQAGKDEILNSRIGPYLRSRAVWLRNVIGISYRKIPQIIEEMHGITFTPAALIGFETMLAERAEPLVDDIAKKLASSDGSVHADETFWTTDGARTFFWVHGDEKYIHFQYDTSRAGQVSRDILGDDFTGTLVTDCYSGYAASAAGAKQKCLAHLARRARRPTPSVGARQKLTEADSIDFAFFEDIKQFVKRACNFPRRRREKKLSRKKQAVEKAWLRAELLRLETCDVSHQKAITLQARLLRHPGEWLVFLDDA